MKHTPSEDEALIVSSSNGTGSGVMGKLYRMLHYHEERAAAYRMVIDEVSQQRRTSSTTRARATLRQAIMQDAARRQDALHLPQKKKPGRRSHHTPRPAGTTTRGTWSSKLKAQRSVSATILAKFSEIEPRPGALAGRSLGVYVNRGYLIQKAHGQYLRTSKEFRV